MPEKNAHPVKKLVFLVLGVVFLILGISGLVLPVLPGVVFLIIALELLAKGSDRFHHWLLNNRWFGRHLQNLENNGVPLKLKITGAAFICLSLVINLVFVIHSVWLQISAFLIAGTLIFWLFIQPARKK